LKSYIGQIYPTPVNGGTKLVHMAAQTVLQLAAAKTGLTRAEAHRQAMMAMIDAGPARNANPALWAPFVVVGEGGIRHAR